MLSCALIVFIIFFTHNPGDLPIRESSFNNNLPHHLQLIKHLRIHLLAGFNALVLGKMVGAVFYTQVVEVGDHYTSAVIY